MTDGFPVVIPVRVPATQFIEGKQHYFRREGRVTQLQLVPCEKDPSTEGIYEIGIIMRMMGKRGWILVPP
jgi:hypothetical protein